MILVTVTAYWLPHLSNYCKAKLSYAIHTLSQVIQVPKEEHIEVTWSHGNLQVYTYCDSY